MGAGGVTAEQLGTGGGWWALELVGVGTLGPTCGAVPMLLHVAVCPVTGPLLGALRAWHVLCVLVSLNVLCMRAHLTGSAIRDWVDGTAPPLLL